jgi:hypothetical protein
LVAEKHQRDREDTVDRAAKDIGGDQPHGSRRAAQRPGAGVDVGEHGGERLARVPVGGDEGRPRADHRNRRGRKQEG